MKVTAPPERGKANRGLVSFLAKQLQVKTSQIEIVSGFTSGRKMVKITGLDGDDIQRALMKSVQE